MLKTQHRYIDAEPLYRRSLEIRESALGGEHHDVAASLNNLAVLSVATGKLQEALPLAERAASIFQQALGPEHPHTKQAVVGVRKLKIAAKKKARIQSAKSKPSALDPSGTAGHAEDKKDDARVAASAEDGTAGICGVC
mmetsp:Transcript_3926/g.12056  ORF Transcript_3926/g.12056 Transcript_3926/m.12056 type:complete len:139 (+) Transcript_3926:633-1049(+)